MIDRRLAGLLLCSVCGLGGCRTVTTPSSPPSHGVANTTATRRTLWLDPSHAEWRREAPAVSHLRFETTKGVFTLEVHRAWGPLGADRLYNLARLGYYDDTRFHRVNARYIAQWGLHGDSAVNAAWKGRYLADDPPRSRNARGTFAFSYEGPGKPNTRNTQLYVNLADNARNDAEPFTILGTVIEGMAVLDSLYSGYGENAGSGVRQGRQGPLERGGNAFMDREYPKLDRILRATVSTPARSAEQSALSVVIDGAFDEWRAVPEWARFPAAPAMVSAPATVQATDDARFWYLSVALRDSTAVSAMPGTMHVLIDTDADSTTGGTAYDMRGVDFALDLSRLDKPQAGGHGAGIALRTVTATGLGDFRSAYDLQVVALPSWSTNRFELRIARDGAPHGWPRLGAQIRARLVRVAPDSARTATPVQRYAFATPLDTAPVRGAQSIPQKAPGAVRVVHWNVSEGSFRTPENHAKLLAAVAPEIIVLDEVPGDVDSTALAAFFARPELAHLGSWRFVHGQSGSRQRGVVAARGRTIRPVDAMRYMRYPDGSLDSLARSDARMPARLIEIERRANIASTGAWVDVDGIETLFVTVDLTSAGYLGSPNDAFRLLQARTMRRYVLDAIGQGASRAPVVIAGDYNSVASYESVRTLQQSLDTDGSDLALNHALRLDGRTAATWRNDSVAQFTPGRLDLALYSDRVFEQAGGFVFAAEDLADEALRALGLTRRASKQASDHLIVVTDLKRARPINDAHP